ncbi:MAG: hypothetical protein VR72_21520 [Clostridiaceae bacterium BRH_c20a]|nr:MAG: hypothetical protein VR72_21520 [Clostridiaceae bacterium BRH_c20a]
MTTKSPVDIKKLSKKYKLDISKVINAWKADKSDTEISQALHIDLLKLLQIRQEVEDVHLRDRMTKKRVKRNKSP